MTQRYTCWLVAFLAHDAGGFAIRSFGLFSEPHPSVSYTVWPVTMLEISSGTSYGDARDRTLAAVAGYANSPGRMGEFWAAVKKYLEQLPQ